MPVRIYWGNEAKTFTVFEFEGNWTWQEYYETRSEGILMVSQVSHMVNIIVDVTKGKLLPNNIMTHFRSSIEKSPAPFDICVVVSDSRLIAAMINVMTKLRLPIKIIGVKTLGEAIQIIEDYDKAKAITNS